MRAMRSTCCAGQAEILDVAPPVFEKLAFGDRAEGVLAVAETPDTALDRLTIECAHDPQCADVLAGCVRAGSRGVAPLVAVLEAVEKPGNMGAVLRSAEGAGVSAVIVADSRTDLYNPNAIRASLGTIFTLPLAAATAGETLAWLQARRFTICAARVDGSHLYTEIDYRRSTAIVLGCEAEGLSDTWRGEDLQTVRLPMLGAADSLNLSATAAVLFYEALRQRSDLTPYGVFSSNPGGVARGRWPRSK